MASINVFILVINLVLQLLLEVASFLREWVMLCVGPFVQTFLLVSILKSFSSWVAGKHASDFQL